ncbi:hypothetical protein ACIBHX_43205 [Nonomuraea sp. NPDC050536]|uniref:hypothetical protein n=1 Tax=Nonomuraea sp. NPDC050536 TaxID=3364366 RepID=UPI0037C63CC0
MRTAFVAAGAGAGLLASVLAANPASAEPRTQYYYASATVTVDTTRWDTPACPGGKRQFFTAKDANGVDIAYTYSNNKITCVTVAFKPRTLDRDCDFYFYVPKGHATANVRLRFATDRGIGDGTLINENPTDGWEYVRTARNVTDVWFTDANGQDSGQIGWGMDSVHGIKQVCRV